MPAPRSAAVPSIATAPTPPHPNQRALVVEQALGGDRQSRHAGIADRDQHIADESIAADALDRRFRKQGAKCRIVEPRKPGQIRRPQAVARGQFCLVSLLGELVPWADRETIVAAIDPIADRLAEFMRDRPLAFDGEIGNAAPGIELVRRWKRRGRQISRQAWQEPQWSVSAPSRGRSRLVKMTPRNSHEPNSRETRLVCLPCSPVPRLAPVAFHHRGGVDEYLDLGAGPGDQPSRQRLQPRLDQIVIIVALRIDRDRAACALRQDRQRSWSGP